MIPKENLLGEIGKGHKIAFNILNVGRFKLGAGVTGGAKLALESAIEYGKSRLAFGQPDHRLRPGAQKIGEMAMLVYVSESVVYRTAGMIDTNLEGAPLNDPAEALKRIEEYDVECSMVKVWCSEMLDYVVDETVQIFGGAGFVEDYPAERYWRDARVNRIFEGTNEINRLLVPGPAHPPRHEGRAARLREGHGPHGRVHRGPVRCVEPTTASWPPRPAWCTGAKKVALMCLGLAAQKFGDKLENQQEVLGLFADIAMDIYALESAVAPRPEARGARGRGQGARCRRPRCGASPRRPWTASRPPAAGSWPPWTRATCCARTWPPSSASPSARRWTPSACKRQIAAAAIDRGGGYPLG